MECWSNGSRKKSRPLLETSELFFMDTLSFRPKTPILYASAASGEPMRFFKTTLVLWKG